MSVQAAEMEYHTMFPDIDERALQAVRYIVREKGLWRVGKDEGFNLLRELYSRLSEVYGFPTPSLVEAGFEHYYIPGERIGLPKVSLVSALHEYRHHMQKYGRRRFPNVEVDARGWSISCFRLALPEEFDRAWREGKIWYMPPHP